MLDVRILLGRSPVNFQVTLGTHCSTLSPQRASGRCARALEAQLNLNTDLLQKPMGEWVLSFAMVLNYDLKSDLITSCGLLAWQEKPWAYRSEIEKASQKTAIRLNLDLAV